MPWSVPPLEELPPRLRAPVLAKKAELRALEKIAEGKKKPFLRRLGAEDAPRCEAPETGSESKLGILRLAKYEPISEDEERWSAHKDSRLELPGLADAPQTMSGYKPHRMTAKKIVATIARPNSAKMFFIIKFL